MTWIFLMFPETLFIRAYDTGLDSTNVSVATSDEEKSSPVTETHESTSQPTIPPLHTTIRKTPYLQQLKPWSFIPPNQNLLSLFFRPWPMIVYPALLYSFITFAAVLGWPICVVATNASLYQLPPYNMSPGLNNLINVAAVIGCVIGSLVGGKASDWLGERSARRNGGVFEPESRLLALIPSFFIVPVGLLM